MEDIEVHRGGCVSLNIKNEETHQLARKLAERTGESLTEAVTIAIKERLARTGSTDEQIEARIEALMAIARDVADRMPAGFRAVDHGEMLYDEYGLPK